MSGSEEEGIQTESRSPIRAQRTPSSLAESSSNSNTGREKLTSSQRICQLLLERHGSRITQLLLQNEEGKQLLRAFLALSFSPAAQEGGNCLVRIIERDPESLLPLLLKKSGEKSVARGLAVCLLRGVSNATAEDLKPVVAALSEAILEPLGEQAEAQKPAGGTEESSPSADLIAGADDDDGTDKRPDEQAAGGEELLRRPSRVQELIREQQRRCQQQQQQQQLLRQRSSFVRDSAEGSRASRDTDEGKSRKLHERLLIEALIFATSETSSPEAAELCEKLVDFSPGVLTRVIKIEVSRNAAEPPATSPTAAGSGAAETS